MRPLTTHNSLKTRWRLALSERSKSKGFSLLEMVVYITILSALAILVVGSMLQLARSWNSVSLSQDINASANVALERTVRTVRDASSVDTGASTLDTNPGVLALSIDGDNTVFSVENGAVVLTVDGDNQGPLTSADVSVTSLVFSHYAGAQSEVVTIDMELTASRGSITKVVPFHASAVLRGSY